MRSVLFLLVAILSSNISFAQPDQNAGPMRGSLLDRISSNPGTILKKEISDIGQLKTLKVQLVKAVNIVNKDQQFTLVRLAYGTADAYSPLVKAADMDIAAIDELGRKFDQIRASMPATPAGSYSEITFKTRDGLTGGYYSTKGAWAPFLRLSDNDPESYILFEKEDQDKLMSLLDLCKQKLRPQAPTK